MSLQGGHDEDFVESPADDCMCPICLLVARDPVLTRCGHTLCESCCGRLKKRNEDVECPVDRKTLRKDDIFPDEKLKRKILQLDVKCREHSSGCRKVVNLQHLENHMNTCGYVYVACPNGCNEVMPRSAVTAHKVNLCPKRMVSCEYCSARMFFQVLQNHQITDCRAFPVRCPLCSKALLRYEIQQHLSEEGGDCPKIVIACEYTEIGCQTKCAREFMSAHLTNSTEKHMELLRKNNRELKDGMRDLQLKVDEQSLKIENVLSFTIKPPQIFRLNFTSPLNETRKASLANDLVLVLETSREEPKPKISEGFHHAIYRLLSPPPNINVRLTNMGPSPVTFVVYKLKVDREHVSSSKVVYLNSSERANLAQFKDSRSSEKKTQTITLKYKTYHGPKGSQFV